MRSLRPSTYSRVKYEIDAEVVSQSVTRVGPPTGMKRNEREWNWEGRAASQDRKAKLNSIVYNETRPSGARRCRRLRLYLWRRDVSFSRLNDERDEESSTYSVRNEKLVEIPQIKIMKATWNTRILAFTLVQTNQLYGGEYKMSWVKMRLLPSAVKEAKLVCSFLYLFLKLFHSFLLAYTLLYCFSRLSPHVFSNLCEELQT